jgi:hypothetical protein
MGVVIEMRVKYPGGRTRNRGTDVLVLSVLVKAILCHPFIYGSPAPPLLSRTPITKYISSCKVNSSTSTK